MQHLVGWSDGGCIGCGSAVAAVSIWKDDPRNDQRLTELWAEGHVTTEIGRRLRVSKNAVIGRAHVLGLPGRKSPIRPKTGAGHPKTARLRPKRVLLPRFDVPLPPPAPLPALAAPASELPKMPDRIRVVAPPAAILRFVPSNMASHQFPPSRKCCWPLGELRTPEFRFCADWVTRPGPYCEDHRKLAYTSRAVEAEAA